MNNKWSFISYKLKKCLSYLEILRTSEYIARNGHASFKVKFKEIRSNSKDLKCNKYIDNYQVEM